MNNFNSLIQTIESIDAVVLEHCKTGDYFRAFNMLQAKILRSVYENYLRSHVKDADFGEIKTDSEIIMIFIDNYPSAIKLLGDVLCKKIPNEKVIRHSMNDVDVWATKLFYMMKEND